MAGILPESATERLLREMSKQGRLFDEISGTGELRRYRSPIDDLLERTRNSTLSLAGLHARGGAGDIAMKIAQGLNIPSGSASAPALPRQFETARGGAIRSISDLGPLIRKARKTMKLNQAQFAAHAGVGRRFLSELEGGKPSLEFDKVLACAAAAGIDVFARARSS